MTGNPRWAWPLIGLIIAGAVFAAYSSSLAKPFMWDDLPFILYETSYRSLSNIPHFFATDSNLLYRPLRSVAYTLAYAVFGHQPMPYRFIALTLHAIISILFAGIVYHMGRSRKAATLAGLVFALHPVHADRVANTTGAFDLIGLAFAYAAFLVFLARRKSSFTLHPSSYFLHPSSFILLLAAGLLGSEEAVTVPLFIAALMWIFPKENGAADRRYLAISVLVTLAYLALRTTVIGRIARFDLIPPPPFSHRMFTMSAVVWHEFAKVLFPFSLRPAYWTEIRTSFLTPATLLGAAALATVAVVLWKCRSSGKGSAFALAWFFLALAPFAQIIPGDTYIAERYLYSAVGGLAIFAAVCTDAVVAQGFPTPVYRGFARGLVLACLFFMALHTFNRGYVWSDEYRLWEDASRKDDKAALILTNLGNAFKQRKTGADPCSLFDRAIRYNPNYGKAYIGAGECSIRRGATEEGLARFLSARRLLGPDKDALAALAQTYVLTERWDDAGKTAEALLSMRPDSLVAHYVLGYIDWRFGDMDSAVEHLSEAADSTNEPRESADAARSLLQRIQKGAIP